MKAAPLKVIAKSKPSDRIYLYAAHVDFNTMHIQIRVIKARKMNLQRFKIKTNARGDIFAATESELISNVKSVLNFHIQKAAKVKAMFDKKKVSLVQVKKGA